MPGPSSQKIRRGMSYPPEVVGELEEALERYLHDANASQPVEPFHSALAALVLDRDSQLWDLLETDPASFRREPPEPGLEDPDAVASRLARLVREGAECAACPVRPWCAGWFKWPAPDYDCTDVRRLFDRLERAAGHLRADLAEARELLP